MIVEALTEAHFFQCFDRALATVTQRHMRVGVKEWKLHVLTRGSAREQIEALENETDFQIPQA
jgi:hypothetical protein